MGVSDAEWVCQMCLNAGSTSTCGLLAHQPMQLHHPSSHIHPLHIAAGAGWLCMPIPNVSVATSTLGWSHWRRTRGQASRHGILTLLLSGEPWPGGLAEKFVCLGQNNGFIRSSQAMLHHISLQHMLTAPLPPSPIILTVLEASGLATGEMGAVCVGTKTKLGSGGCRGRKERSNVMHLCHVGFIPHLFNHGWHRDQQPWRYTVLTINCCGDQPEDAGQVTNTSWWLLLSPWPLEVTTGLVGLGLADGVVGEQLLLQL